MQLLYYLTGENIQCVFLVEILIWRGQDHMTRGRHVYMTRQSRIWEIERWTWAFWSWPNSHTHTHTLLRHHILGEHFGTNISQTRYWSYRFILFQGAQYLCVPKPHPPTPCSNLIWSWHGQRLKLEQTLANSGQPSEPAGDEIYSIRDFFLWAKNGMNHELLSILSLLVSYRLIGIMNYDMIWKLPIALLPRELFSLGVGKWGGLGLFSLMHHLLVQVTYKSMMLNGSEENVPGL